MRYGCHGRLFSLIAGALLLSASAALAGPVTIDDFSTPNPEDVYIINFTDSDPYTKLYTGSGIQGERTITIDVQGKSGPVSAVGTIGEGAFTFNSGIPGSVIQINWTGPAGAGLGGLDLVDGTNNAIQLVFDYLDGGAAPTIGIQMVLSSPAGNAVLDTAVASNPNPSAVALPFSSFTTSGTFSFDSVDFIFLAINPLGVRNADFSLNLVQAIVPEPTSLALLLSMVGFGGVILGTHRLLSRRG